MCAVAHAAVLCESAVLPVRLVLYMRLQSLRPGRPHSGFCRSGSNAQCAAVQVPHPLLLAVVDCAKEDMEAPHVLRLLVIEGVASLEL